mgnify:CR=1 FL=1
MLFVLSCSTRTWALSTSKSKLTRWSFFYTSLWIFGSTMLLESSMKQQSAVSNQSGKSTHRLQFISRFESISFNSSKPKILWLGSGNLIWSKIHKASLFRGIHHHAMQLEKLIISQCVWNDLALKFWFWLLSKKSWMSQNKETNTWCTY